MSEKVMRKEKQNPQGIVAHRQHSQTEESNLIKRQENREE